MWDFVLSSFIWRRPGNISASLDGPAGNALPLPLLQVPARHSKSNRHACARAWYALSPSPSSSASCLLRPIKCCGAAWSRWGPLDSDPEAVRPGRQNNNKIFEKTIALLSNRHTRLQGNGGHRGCDTCREGSILMSLWLKYISLFAIRHLVFIRRVIVALSLVAAIERKCSDSPVLCCSVYHTV